MTKNTNTYVCLKESIHLLKMFIIQRLSGLKSSSDETNALRT